MKDAINYTNKNDYVYRIMSYDKFIDVLFNQRFTFVKPFVWGDPYENFLLNNTRNLENDIYSTYRNCLFAQCWTYNEETDFMWKVFAPCKNGIKIKVRISNLLESLPINPSMGSIYFGPVEYKSKEKIFELFSKEEMIKYDKNLRAKPSLEKMASSLFYKRKEFIAENEFRIVYFNESNSTYEDSAEILTIKPIEIIEEIVIDPRIDNFFYLNYKKTIERMGINPNIIRKSDLYSL